MKRMILAILTAVISIPLSAQAVSDVWVTSDTLHIYFPQGESVLDSAFRDNGTSLKIFAEEFHVMKSRPRSKVRGVLIVSGASPEGNYLLNKNLSDSRAKALYDYILAHELLLPSEIEVESRGVDWKGFEAQVAMSDKPYKRDVLEIMERFRSSDAFGEKKIAAIKRLDDGKVWEDVFETYFPDLRGTMVMISWDIKRDTNNLNEVSEVSHEVRFDAPVQSELNYQVEMPGKPKEKWQFRMAAKTNLLYDGMTIPNLGVEFGLWKGLVLNVEYMHNIWLHTKERNFTKKNWYRVHGAEFGLKYYINEFDRPFEQGHHVGLSGQMLTFDVTGIVAEAWGGGVVATYGYTLPITSRLNLDFEAGLGFIAGDIHKYDVVEYDKDVYYRIYRKTEKAAFVPKLGVTLQYLIGVNNYNSRRK